MSDKFIDPSAPPTTDADIAGPWGGDPDIQYSDGGQVDPTLPPPPQPNINMPAPPQTNTRASNPLNNYATPRPTSFHTTRRETRPQGNQEKGIVNSQPQPSSPMRPTNVRGGGDRNAYKVPIMGDGLRSWSFGLFDCLSDLPTCLRATFSPCYIYSLNRQRLDHLETLGQPLQGRVEWFNHECISYVALQFLYAGWALQAISRHDVRRRYGIRGDGFSDILTSGCCIPCELVQEHREIELEEQSLRI